MQATQLLRPFFLLLAALIIGLLLTLLVFISLWRHVPSDLPMAEGSASWIVNQVNLVDVENGTLLANRAVEIVDGKIARIGTAGEFSDSSLPKIDGAGAYLMPGLVDMHVHIYDRRELVTNLAYGVTSVRNLRGFPTHLRWQKELNAGEWQGARLYTSSPALSGPDHAHALQQVVETPEHARELVRRYKNDGYDSIKAYGYLAPEVFSALVDEANKLNLPIAKHAPHAPESLELSTLTGMQSLEHVEDIFQGPLGFTFDENKLDNYLDELSALDVFVTPTLATFHHLMKLSTDKNAFVSSLDLHHINPFVRELLGDVSVQRWLDADESTSTWNQKEFKFLQRISLRLYEEGIPLLVGSDAGTMFMTAGISTHREMQLMQDAGIPAAEVIRAATLNAAVAMGVEDQYGSIAIGKTADLLLVKSNPFDSVYALEKPLGVLQGGRYYDQTRLDELLASAGETASYVSGALTIFEDILVRSFH